MMLLFAAAMALLMPGDEQIALPMADGFVTVAHQAAQAGAIEQRVPRGETVQQWTRMVTLLEINSAVPAETYLTDFTTHMAAICPGARSAPRFKSTLAGRRMIEGRLDCPRNTETGQPETFLYRIYQGEGRLHVLQIAFRSVPTDAQIAWARKQLSDATICGGAGPACAS